MPDLGTGATYEIEGLQIREGELVGVRWGRGAILEAVVCECADRGVRVCFEDEGHALSGASAWVETSQLQVLRAADGLPPWLQDGKYVLALNPSSEGGSWQRATILKSRRGLLEKKRKRRPEEKFRDVRLQLRFEDGLVSWQGIGNILQPDNENSPADQLNAVRVKDGKDCDDGASTVSEGAAKATADRTIGVRSAAPLRIEAKPCAATVSDTTEAIGSTASCEGDTYVDPAGAGEDAEVVELQSVADSSLSDIACQVCHSPERADQMLLCDQCDDGYHMQCLTPRMDAIPDNEWFCPKCRFGVDAVRADAPTAATRLPEENDAVCVAWGRKGRGSTTAYSAVVCAVEERHALVQFDVDASVARVPLSRVRVMPVTTLPPELLGEAVEIEAVDPSADAPTRWHDAEVLDARQGAEQGERGLRLWVRYRGSKLCQWLRIEHVRAKGSGKEAPSRGWNAVPRAAGGAERVLGATGLKKRHSQSNSSDQKRSREEQGSEATRDDARSRSEVASRNDAAVTAISRVSCQSGSTEKGCELWLMLERHVPLRHGARYIVWFGAHSAEAELLAPRVLACRVPRDAPPASVQLRVTVEMGAKSARRPPPPAQTTYGGDSHIRFLILP
uniref:PHD-type domain-containing protein n=1 Tax=Chrysotila carterae TaxID=13221 RepID=A0A7S4B6B0_CHRCT